MVPIVAATPLKSTIADSSPQEGESLADTPPPKKTQETRPTRTGFLQTLSVSFAANSLAEQLVAQGGELIGVGEGTGSGAAEE